jgi:uncharacterized protein (DUF1800 family)
MTWFAKRASVSIAIVSSAVALSQTPVRSTPSPDFNPTLDAARLLSQAAFGANRAEINRVAGIGANAWLNEQFAKPQTSHVATVLALHAGTVNVYGEFGASLWKQFFEGPDQLRQRVVFALSQIMVISTNNAELNYHTCGPAGYVDILGQHAFGNFRDLLKDITLNPAMGEYLNMKRSGKLLSVTNADGTVAKFYPNENYARELLQLFSVGPVLLNLDGTPKLDSSGKPLPSYDESIVKGFAQAFTGWTFAEDAVHDPEWNTPGRWNGLFIPSSITYPSGYARFEITCNVWKAPMQPWTRIREQVGKYEKCNLQSPPDYSTCIKADLPPPHETSSKKLLSGTNLPAGQTPMQDIDAAMDNIFNHPNVGPFIGKQLIQRLTMSNPQPPYVERVARAFNDNGKGVRGDMKAVIRAILLDPDARLHLRAEGPLAGKLKEPVVRFISYFRALNAKPASGHYIIRDLSDPSDLYQSPLRAPSVFNFYRPDSPLPGQPATSPVLAPEFSLATTNAVTEWGNFFSEFMLQGWGKSDPPNHIKPDYTALEALAQTDIPRMIDELSMLLLAGSITPSFRAGLIDAVGKVRIEPGSPPIERVYVALWSMVNSPEFLVQK